MAFFVINRLQDTTAFIISDDGRQFEVPLRALPEDVQRGSVLRLNLDHPITGDWSSAAVDHAERVRREASS